MKPRPTALIGYATDTGQVRAWCPHCRKWHLHGIPGEKITGGRIVGHWAPHCTVPDSPFKTGGYEVRLMTKADIKAIADSLRHYG